MRALVIVAAMFATTAAHAETVLVMADAEHDAALRVAMAGRGVAVTGSEAPAGALRLERAAAAQRAARHLGADAAVWIDERDVCAVTADGRAFRQSPLPIEAASPRAFAAIATSLLDEMIRPDHWLEGFDVNVNVSVTPRTDGRRVAVVSGPSLEPPGLTDAPPPPLRVAAPRTHARPAIFESGMVLSPISAGLQLGFSFRVDTNWRFGATAGLNLTWDTEYVLGMAAVELRHVGRGANHWDLGPEAGYISDGEIPVLFLGARIARTWELDGSAVSLGFTPMILVAPGGEGAIPGIYSSLRWMAPL